MLQVWLRDTKQNRTQRHFMKLVQAETCEWFCKQNWPKTTVDVFCTFWHPCEWTTKYLTLYTAIQVCILWWLMYFFASSCLCCMFQWFCWRIFKLRNGKFYKNNWACCLKRSPVCHFWTVRAVRPLENQWFSLCFSRKVTSQECTFECSLHFESALLYEKCKLHPKVHFKSANCTQNCTIEFEETLKNHQKISFIFQKQQKIINHFWKNEQRFLMKCQFLWHIILTPNQRCSSKFNQHNWSLKLWALNSQIGKVPV